ncbi:hypothetical protein [Mycolicibacterium psychrotolerans]|nr:hypothetical protein [Mycolicibacterium psychrotolerans]
MSALTDTVSLARRTVLKAADTTTAAAGAVGGAAINGVAGAVKGAASGVRSGLGSGSQSTTAAALTLGAIGAAGLVEWPVLLTVGGAALVVHQLGRRAADGDQALPAPATAPATRSAPRKAAKAARKKPAPRRTSSR